MLTLGLVENVYYILSHAVSLMTSTLQVSGNLCIIIREFCTYYEVGGACDSVVG
jgi:hypothetical protein